VQPNCALDVTTEVQDWIGPPGLIVVTGVALVSKEALHDVTVVVVDA
jgi:hypothetical protein